MRWWSEALAIQLAPQAQPQKLNQWLKLLWWISPNGAFSAFGTGRSPPTESHWGQPKSVDYSQSCGRLPLIWKRFNSYSACKHIVNQNRHWAETGRLLIWKGIKKSNGQAAVSVCANSVERWSRLPQHKQLALSDRLHGINVRLSNKQQATQTSFIKKTRQQWLSTSQKHLYSTK